MSTTITTTKATADLLEDFGATRQTRTRVELADIDQMHVDLLTARESVKATGNKRKVAQYDRAILALANRIAEDGKPEPVNKHEASDAGAAKQVDAEVTVHDEQDTVNTGSRPARPVTLQAYNEDGTKAGRVVTFSTWEPATTWAQQLVDEAKAAKVTVNHKVDGRELVVA